jgi:6-phosphogluconolactonase
MNPEIDYFPDLESLSLEASGFIFRVAQKCVSEKGLFTLALSGGSTPRRLYERLSQPPFLQEMPWPHMHFFWGDERCVPTDHQESNYGLAFRCLLSKIALPEKNIHRVPVERGCGTEDALDYEKKIRAFFRGFMKDRDSSGSIEERPSVPAFDLILLGLGRDGHTASLFPGDPVLEEKSYLTAYVPVPGQPPIIPRITLTLPLINQADRVLFLVSGAEKREMLQSILHAPKTDRDRYPAARVHPQGMVRWFVC